MASNIFLDGRIDFCTFAMFIFFYEKQINKISKNKVKSQIRTNEVVGSYFREAKDSGALSWIHKGDCVISRELVCVGLRT